METKKVENLTLEVGNNCPLQCKHCSSMSNPSKQNFVDINVIKDFFKTLPNEIEKLEISGGEPFQYNKLVGLLKMSKKYSKNIEIYTSGTTMENGKLNSLSENKLKEIKDLDINKLIFSIHNNQKNKYDSFTNVEGSFDFNKKSREIAKKLGYDVEAHIVPTAHNLDNLKEMTNELLNNGLKRVSFLRLVNQGRARENYLTLKPNDKKLVKILKTLKKENGDQIDIGGHFQGLCPVDRACRAGISKFAITPDHYLFPCTSLKNRLPKKPHNNIKNNRFAEIDLAKIFDASEFGSNPCQKLPRGENHV